MPLTEWLLRQVARSGQPRRTGARRVAGLRAGAAIDRDDRGVPVVRAAVEADLYFAFGYAQAADRLWQMDILRRRAEGRLSEVLGAATADEDVRWRRLALTRVARASEALLDPRARTNLTAFSAGVNAVFGRGWRLPPEFLLLRYRPRPWTPLDSVLIVKQLGFDLGLNLRHEVFRQQDVPAALRTPRYPADGPVTVAAHDGLPRRAPGPMTELPAPSRDWLTGLLDGEHTIGSNAWVVAGERTASGAPLLANDPHVAYTQPSLWYQAGLRLGDEATGYGVTVPGIPGLIAGASRDLAWGITNSWADTQDLATAPPAGTWRENSVVEVRGGDPVPVTASGGDGWVAYGDGAALFWSGCTPSAEIEACQRMWRAKSYAEFREVLRSFGVPVLNVMVAGRDGTIAVKTAGRVPERVRGSGTAPGEFGSVAASWRGFVPFDELPESVDPAAGYLVSANNKVLPDDAAVDLGGDWMPPYRAARIGELITATPAVTADDCARWQTDDLNGRARHLLPLLLPSAPETPAGRTCRALLADWDHHDRGDAAAPLVFGRLMLALADEWLGPLAQTAPDLVSQVDHLVRTPSARDELGLPPLGDTVAAVLDRIGADLGDPAACRYDTVHRITDPHPLGRAGAAPRAVFCGPPTPVGGSNNTVGMMAAGRDGLVVEGAPWRMVAELTPAGPQIRDVLRHGASGHPRSPHYDDQTRRHAQGELPPTPFPPRGGTTLTLHPRTSL